MNGQPRAGPSSVQLDGIPTARAWNTSQAVSEQISAVQDAQYAESQRRLKLQCEFMDRLVTVLSDQNNEDRDEVDCDFSYIKWD